MTYGGGLLPLLPPLLLDAGGSAGRDAGGDEAGGGEAGRDAAGGGEAGRDSWAGEAGRDAAGGGDIRGELDALEPRESLPRESLPRVSVRLRESLLPRESLVLRAGASYVGRLRGTDAGGALRLSGCIRGCALDRSTGASNLPRSVGVAGWRVTMS
jgi:hypothetical protein